LSKIIGIGGVSRSGKTHLSHDIVWHYRQQGKKTIAVRQDDFVKLNGNIPKINDEINWEIPESIDYPLIIKTLNFLTADFDIIIIEGHLIYANKPLVEIIDTPFLLQTTKSTYSRRKADDTRWGNIPKWYVDYIWEAFEKFGSQELTNPVLIKTDYPNIDFVKKLLP
jgi:uridine kinase